MDEIKTRNEYLKASNADGTCVLEAVTTWCPQCKAMAPVMDKLIAQYPEARFYKYDVDTAGDIAQELGVSQMPTFHIFKDGDLEGSITGAKGKELEDLIRESYSGKVA